MKYCEDCRWVHLFAGNIEASECKNELARKSGKELISRKTTILASTARGIYGNCGPEGKLWEGKE